MEMGYEVIFVIVNAGFSDDVMSAARECGAKGGTVINARGTAKEEAEKTYGIVIEPEKEIVLILVDKDIKEAILHSIYKKVGLNSPGQGIAFCLPVDDVIGLTPVKNNDN
jgi:nitrogen regulatory protein PII